MSHNLVRAILRNDFESFIHKVFNTINPDTKFIPNWHISLIADYLESVRNNKIPRLIINVPPRSLKSICASVAFPCWLLAKDPSSRIMVASYSQALSTKHSIDSKIILESNWYKSTFPSTQLIYGTKDKFVTSKLGFRFATSVGGTATGEGADYLIIDDPHNPTYIHSKKLRSKVIDWYEQTFSTRLNDKSKGAIIVVMQRLHSEDLSGYLIKKKTWQVLKLPIMANDNLDFTIGDKTYSMKRTETLHSQRDKMEYLKSLEEEIGMKNFQAQYMQDPLLDNNKLLNELHYCDSLPEKFEFVVQSWDTAIKTGDNNDFSVCTTWGILESRYYLIDILRQRLQYPELKDKVQKLYGKHSPSFVLIEDKGSGQGLIQELQSTLRVIPIKPRLGKIARFCQTGHLWEAGRVLIPKNQSWTKEFVLEIIAFPNSKHDDIVDSTVQFLNYVVSNKKVVCIR